MSSLKRRRFWLTALSTVLAGGVLIAQSAVAQEADNAAQAVKPPKQHAHAFSVSGPLTISGGAPCSSTPTDTCYSLSAPSLKQGKNTASMSGVLEVSGTALTGTPKGSCYSVVSAGTNETVSEAQSMFTVDITFGGNICIKTTKKGSQEILPSSEWMNIKSSPLKGSGHESWVVTPAAPTAPVGPLNGTGTIHINGKVNPPGA